jgi:hypothetical protein
MSVVDIQPKRRGMYDGSDEASRCEEEPCKLRLRPCTCGMGPAKAQPKAEPYVAEFTTSIVHVAWLL